MKEAIALGTNLRNAGINTEIYLNDKKIKAKMKYADRLKIPYVIVVGENEVQANKLKVKNMETGEEKDASFDTKEIKALIK